MVILAKYAVPKAPKPKGAKSNPPVQHRAAKMDVNTDNMLNSFSFIMFPPDILIHTIIYLKRKKATNR